jgi:hypothetical protein
MSGAPEAGAWIGTAVTLLGSLIVWLNKHYEERRRKRDMAAVPPSKPPEHDQAAAAAVLRRLDAMEHESALSVALVRERGVVDDLRRELAETRAERDQLVVELRATRALVERLRAEIRARRARGAVEVSAAEHRDASQAGPLQDSLATVRPPKR